MIAEGDKVMGRWTARGTHRGEFMGIPPTGNQVVWTGMTMIHLADGKIVEMWWSHDHLGMFQKLGVF